MSIDDAWPVPFILDPQNLAVDAVVSFCVSVLLAVMINAEAQAFVATFLGDARKDAKDRFHFNAFLHLSLLGSICYLVGGFGWPRTMPIDRNKFKHPRLFMVITRFAGPAANLLLASIAGSLVMVMKTLSWEPRVFLMVVGVNITTAVYSLIPLPPLAAGSLVYELLPDSQAGVKAVLLQAGPFVIIGLTLMGRLRDQGLFNPYFDPIIRGIFHYLSGGF
jgi:Zn-dependent protease